MNPADPPSVRPVRACQRCASTDLRMPGIRDGALVGTGDELGRWACNRCGLSAVPLLFDDEAARRAYETTRQADPSEDWPASGWPNIRRP